MHILKIKVGEKYCMKIKLNIKILREDKVNDKDIALRERER